MDFYKPALATAKTPEQVRRLEAIAEQRSALVRRPADSVVISQLHKDLVRLTSDQDRMWKFYAANLRAQITGGNPSENLQLATSLNPVRWHDPDYGAFYFHKDLADLMPEGGPQYRKSSNSFSERYIDFMSAINPQPMNEEALEKANEVENERMQENIRLRLIEFEYGEAWRYYDERQQSLPPNRRLTAEQWYMKVGADESIQNQQDVVDAKEGQYLFWMQQALSPDQPLLRALEAHRNFKREGRLLTIKRPSNVMNPADGVAELKDVYPYILSPDFIRWVEEAPRRSPNVTITYSEQSDTYDYSRTRVSGGAVVSFGFFCAIGGGRRTTTEIDITSEDFTFEFNAIVEMFTISPDQWYSSTVFELYQNGPFKPGGPIERAHTEGRLFGPNGFIGFRPARAIVAYKPRVKIKFSRQDYHYFKRETSGWAGFGVGPFVIGGGSYHDVRVRVESNDQDGTLELFGDDDFPYLLGLDYEDMAPGV